MLTQILFGCDKPNELGTTPLFARQESSGRNRGIGIQRKNIGLKEEKLADFNIKKRDLRTFMENSFYAMGILFDITPVKLTLDEAVTLYENTNA